MIIRKTGSAIQSAPISHRSWREVIDEFDIKLESIVDEVNEESVVELWLEDPRSFMEGEINPGHALTGSMIRRPQTGGAGLQRYTSMAKQAAVSGWDQEFAEAKSHADSILKQLGNA
jgi:hypothetical protein